MRIAVMNLQSGVGITKGYWEYLTKAWKYLFPHGFREIEKAGTFIKDSGIDLALCVEVSDGSLRSGFASQSACLRKSSGLRYGNFLPPINKSRLLNEGFCVASAFPIRACESHSLSSGAIPRSLYEISIEIDGKTVRVFIAHLALGSIVRHRQIHEIVQILKNIKEPFILGGDFNERNSAALEILKDTRLTYHYFAPTFPSWKPRHSFEALFFTEEFIVASPKEMLSSQAFSDHLPLIVDVEIT
jgi:endonuclease/exonuclease/phosphatase family metal-dependent hydrolase